MIDAIKEKLGIESKPPKDVYIQVKESNLGIITYMNPIIRQFNKAYKEQLISFLKGILKELEKKTK